MRKALITTAADNIWIFCVCTSVYFSEKIRLNILCEADDAYEMPSLICFEK